MKICFVVLLEKSINNNIKFMVKLERYRPAVEVQFRVGKAERRGGGPFYLSHWKKKVERRKKRNRALKKVKVTAGRKDCFLFGSVFIKKSYGDRSSRSQSSAWGGERKHKQKRSTRCYFWSGKVPGSNEVLQRTGHRTTSPQSVSVEGKCLFNPWINPANTHTDAKPTSQTINI